MNRLEEIEARLAAIAVELDGEGADIDALEAETRALLDEKNQLVSAAEKRNRLKGDIAAGTAGTTVRRMSPEATGSERTFSAGSPEYRSAWLKDIAVDARGRHLLGEMTTEERAAFTFLTTNTGAVVPTEIANRIVELVIAQAPMYADATKTQFTKGFGVPRHKSIDQGDAKAVAEGAANDDEKDTFDLLALDGVEIKKHVTLSKKMEIQSIDAFETWLTQHLADRICVAKEKHTIEQLDNTTYGIAEANKLDGTLTDAEVRKIFGQIKADGMKVVYANNFTIWNVIAGIEDDMGQKLFLPNTMSDPIVAGRVYGAEVKVDETLADNVIYVGVPKKLLANDFDALEIVPQIEPKTLNRIFTGYALFDAGLEDPAAFVKYTHSAG